MHKISPSCSVFETNLKAYSFELVVAGLVLHLQGCSFEDSLRWIATLKAAINNSPPDDTDPLLAEALRLEDTFYYVSYTAAARLDCVLLQSSLFRRCVGHVGRAVVVYGVVAQIDRPQERGETQKNQPEEIKKLAD